MGAVCSVVYSACSQKAKRLSVIETDVCVLGAGSGGLSYAAGAAQMGARVLILESGKMGGDCLNSGCVPSKALLAASKAAVSGRKAASFGVEYNTPKVDYSAVLDHVRDTISKIEPNDSAARFEKLGCTVINAHGRFISSREVECGSKKIRAKRFIIATGSSPSIPDIPGLKEAPYYTTSTIWRQKTLPKQLIIIGGGPVGLEMALAYQRLGTETTVIETDRILRREDPDLVNIARSSLEQEGIKLVEGANITKIRSSAGLISAAYVHNGQAQHVSGTHLLLATGRSPNINGLNLGVAGVATGSDGIKANSKGATTNRRIFAVGDVATKEGFTHVAGHQASTAIQNTILPPIPFRKAENRTDAYPRVTFLDPDVAQVGLNEETAIAQGVRYRVETADFDSGDRFVAERKTQGLIKVLVDAQDRVIGAGIVGHAAGELIHHWSLAVHRRDKITSLVGYIAPYPTMGEINKKIAGKFVAPKIFNPFVRRLVRFWLRFL